MGFTPTGGFMMGTRTGDLDPGILLYLLNEKRYDARQLARLMDRSGRWRVTSPRSPARERSASPAALRNALS